MWETIMADEAPKQYGLKKLKIAIDILSIVAFVFLVTFCPLWMRFHPHIRDEQGHLVWVVKVSFVVTPLCALGLVWLCIRGARSMPALYFRPLYFVHWVITCLAMNYFVYLILTNLVWS
jgi:hypothetical protein